MYICTVTRLMKIQVLEHDLHGTQGFLLGLQDVKGSAHICRRCRPNKWKYGCISVDGWCRRALISLQELCVLLSHVSKHFPSFIWRTALNSQVSKQTKNKETPPAFHKLDWFVSRPYISITESKVWRRKYCQAEAPAPCLQPWHCCCHFLM